MRYIFTLLILVSCLAVRGQEYREYFDSTGFYLVQYDIDKLGFVMVPLVGYSGDGENPNKSHYEALVTVYQIKTKIAGTIPKITAGTSILRIDTIMVGTSFKGQYVEGGCFEDRPEDMVNHAKKLQAEMRKPKK